MELHEIESAILLAEADAAIARANQAKIRDRRDALKASIKEVKDATAAEIYRLQQELRDKEEALRREANEQIATEENEYQSLANAQWDASSELRKANQKLEDLQKMRDVAARANLKAAEFATLEQRWDLLTMGAPWREWAKDHQISGAKKMVYEGRMILGDTMGLGKTLTSLIALDMIQAATKDATPDNPVEFGSMK